jgi:nucleoside-diphosphate-sugar epimerase
MPVDVRETKILVTGGSGFPGSHVAIPEVVFFGR